jgi:hypothetical protein
VCTQRGATVDLVSTSRRDWLTMCGAAALWAGCRNGADAIDRGTVRVPDPIAPQLPIDDGVLDEILEQLQAREPRANHGLSTHAPMVVDALCVLGLADRAKRWLAGYGGPDLELPQPHQPIDPDRWREALGPKRGAPSWEAELHRWADWRELFLVELRGPHWRVALDHWVARLAPGLSSAATHGVIRTAHAARALARKDTQPRRAELARGLAYWAAAYEELPARPGAHALDLAAALARVPRHADRHAAAPRGNIVNGLREVARLDGFDDVRDLVTTPDDAATGLSTLTAAFARVYLQHGTRGHAVAFVHAVTGPAALRKLAPNVQPATARDAFPFAWQTAAAVYAAYARADHPPNPATSKLAPTELVGRAVDNGNDHAIKFTEALVAEHALAADNAYLAAAEDAVARL